MLFFKILTLILMVVAFFAGGHVNKKYCFPLLCVKRCVIPLSRSVEPFIDYYTFRDVTKRSCRKFLIKIVISFIISFLYHYAVGISFTLGFFIGFFIWLGRSGINGYTCDFAEGIFKTFVKPDCESALSTQIDLLRLRAEYRR